MRNELPLQESLVFGQMVTWLRFSVNVEKGLVLEVLVENGKLCLGMIVHLLIPLIPLHPQNIVDKLVSWVTLSYEF